MERQFLSGATGVFFESKWGLEEAVEAYGLCKSNLISIRNAGVLEPPRALPMRRKDSPPRLITIAKHFRQKGGDLVLDAFRRVKADFPGLNWSIVGGAPEFDWRAEEGITYEGFLRPDTPSDLERFKNLLTDAFLLVHPTREDTNPLVLIEAAYFGCPSISVNDFAIPELIESDKTGVLLERPINGEKIAEKIRFLLRDTDRYEEMRRASRERSVKMFSWDEIGNQLVLEMKQRANLF